VIIIGSGPGGLTAGIYTSRAMRDTLIFEGDSPGGLLVGNPTVQNWPGIKEISGFELMQEMRNHAKHAGCKLVSDYVTGVDFSKLPYKIFTRSGREYKTKAMIIAMGVQRRKINCPGESEYWHKGVSACATCDAPLFRGKKVVVVGGGATALTEAHHLSHFAKEVTVIHRSARFRTLDPIKYVIEKDENVIVKHNLLIEEIKGDGRRVTSVVVKDSLTEKISNIKTDGLFVAIGFDPNTKMFEGKIRLDERGYIQVFEGAQTSQEGVFAAGDIIHHDYQQAVVASGDGCRASLDCVKYLDVLNARDDS
jgi:thioredoxin reductase (NADPH)